MKNWMSILSLLAVTISAQASLIYNGDMSSTTYAPGGNNSTFADVDSGWAVKNKTAISLSTNPGMLTWNGATAGLLEDALAQINSVTTETGSSLTLSFDWTAISGSTTPDLEYQVIGWQVIDGADPFVDADKFFNNINGESRGVSGNAKANVINLLDGNNHGSGTTTPVFNTFAGTAGTTQSASIEIDLSSYGAGFDDISDYDYVGVRFWIADDNADLSAIGSTLDNVGLTAAIPEPATIGLLGLSAVAMLALRRRIG